jgi:hypothetical protein
MREFARTIASQSALANSHQIHPSLNPVHIEMPAVEKKHGCMPTTGRRYYSCIESSYECTNPPLLFKELRRKKNEMEFYAVTFSKVYE